MVGCSGLESSIQLDLAEAHSSFPEPKIEKTPTYVVFDYTKEVFRSHRMEDLVEFQHRF